MENRKFFLLFGGFFLFIGLMLVVQGFTTRAEAMRHRGQWMRGEGRIERKWIVPATRTGALVSAYWIEYGLRTADGGEYRRAVEVDPEEYEGYGVGAAIAVFYPRTEPSKSRLPEEGEPPGGGGELLAGAFAALFGGSLFGWNLARVLEARRSRARVKTEAAPAAPLLQSVRNLLRWVLWILAVLLFAGIAENIPALKRLEESMAAGEPYYVMGAIGVMLLGLALFVGALLVRMKETGQSSDSFQLTEWKQAVRSGAWREPVWRYRMVIVAGAGIMMLGMAALFFAAGPAFVKAGTVLAVLYAGFLLARSW